MQNLKVTKYKPYSVFEIYHAKYTKFSSILYLATFSVHCAVKSHVYHGTQISYKYHINTIFMHNVIL